MIFGSSEFGRASRGILAGIIPVRVGPPGSKALTVTLVPSRSCDQIIVSDSSARALPVLATGLGVQSGRPRRPRPGYGARRQHGPDVSGRAARGRLRDPHSLRTSAILDAPPRALAAAAACACAGSVGRRADVTRRESITKKGMHPMNEMTNDVRVHYTGDGRSEEHTS